MRWQSRALCRELVLNGLADPDDWFPSTDGNGRSRGCHAVYKRARLVCDECPVRAECLQHALENGETEGVWGGLSPHERRKVKREAAA